MRALILVTAAFLIAAAASGCRGREPADIAAAAAMPVMQNPVGPVPGPGGFVTQISNPYGNDAAALQQGRALFVVMNCSGCHGGHAGGGMGPSLRDVDWIYGSGDADIFNSIAQGRANGMPAWGTRIPEQSIWMLVAYVKSLRTQREPDPPR
jgi:cytochrome c oxidase cbb3-type subunit 3